MTQHRWTRGESPGTLAGGMLTLTARTAAAPSFPLSSDNVADSNAISRAMPQLAEQVLAGYRDDNRARYLDNVFRIQIITGKFQDAQSKAAVPRIHRGAAARLPARFPSVRSPALRGITYGSTATKSRSAARAFAAAARPRASPASMSKR